VRIHSSVKKGEIGFESQRLFVGGRSLEIAGSIHNDMSPCKEWQILMIYCPSIFIDQPIPDNFVHRIMQLELYRLVV
jgi:hypothetical protein